MATQSVVITRTSAWAAGSILTLSLMLVPAAGADVAPGDVISRSNAEKAEGLVSPGILWAIRNGMDLNITPYKKITVPKKITGVLLEFPWGLQNQTSRRLAAAHIPFFSGPVPKN